MSENNIFKPFIFDSPIDFVLIGLVHGKEQVLIKSRDLDLDLLGWYQNFTKEKRSRFIKSYNSPFLPPQFHNQYIEVGRVGGTSQHDFINENRFYNVVLLWKGIGENPRSINEEIKHELKTRIADIMISIEIQDRNQLEWNMAPIINLCNHFSENNKRRQLNRSVFFKIKIPVIIIFFILIILFSERILSFL